ncbi:TPA: hypothetical protein ACP5DO_005386, partial [Escherichia coli]
TYEKDMLREALPPQHISGALKPLPLEALPYFLLYKPSVIYYPLFWGRFHAPFLITFSKQLHIN